MTCPSTSCCPRPRGCAFGSLRAPPWRHLAPGHSVLSFRVPARASASCCPAEVFTPTRFRLSLPAFGVSSRGSFPFCALELSSPFRLSAVLLGPPPAAIFVSTPPSRLSSLVHSRAPLGVLGILCFPSGVWLCPSLLSLAISIALAAISIARPGVPPRLPRQTLAEASVPPARFDPSMATGTPGACFVA